MKNKVWEKCPCNFKEALANFTFHSAKEKESWDLVDAVCDLKACLDWYLADVEEYMKANRA